MAMVKPHEPNHYDILGVARDVSVEEIKSRYKALVLKLHPDRERSHIAKAAIVQINNAYETLSDPRKRRAYDTFLRVQSDERIQMEKERAIFLAHYFGMVLSKRTMKILLAAVVISFVAGIEVETLPADGKVISQGFLQDKRHYFGAMGSDLLVSLPLCVPLFGMAWGAVASFTSGVSDQTLVVGALAHPSWVSWNALQYVLFATAVKMLVYYVGICRSLTLVYLIKNRWFSKLNVLFTKGDILAVALLSLAAGYLEHAAANSG